METHGLGSKEGKTWVDTDAYIVSLSCCWTFSVPLEQTGAFILFQTFATGVQRLIQDLDMKMSAQVQKINPMEKSKTRSLMAWVQSALLACLCPSESDPPPPPSPHWTVNIILQVLPFWVFIAGSQMGRWPGISPGSNGDSWRPPLGEGPGMNHLLQRHATPLALFQALAAPQDFTAGYCSCQRGRERGMFTQRETDWRTHMHTFRLKINKPIIETCKGHTFNPPILYCYKYSKKKKHTQISLYVLLLHIVLYIHICIYISLTYHMTHYTLDMQEK